LEISVSAHEWPIYWYRPQKSHIGRSLPKIQSNFVSRASSLAQLFRIGSGIDLIVKTHKNYKLSLLLLRLICLVVVTAVTLLLLLNDTYKLESLQGDGSRTRQEIPQTAGCKARACNCYFWSQHIYYITIDVYSYEHGAEKILSLSNIQQMSAIQQWELFIHTYIHLQNQSWQSVAQLCLWSTVYQRWRCYKYTCRTCKITVEKNDWVAIALMILHRNVYVTYSKSI